MQDKKAKKEMPLVGWNIAEPDETDKVQDTTVTLKVLKSSLFSDVFPYMMYGFQTISII